MCRRERLCACAALLMCVARAGAALLPLDAERLSAGVGGYAVFNCHLDFPFGNEIPYHLQWDKDGESIYSWYSGLPAEEAAVAERWGGRVRRLAEGRLGLGRGSINVSAVRETDAGLYRCRVTFPNRTPPARNNGTLYYLEVEGGNLIATPPMNVTVLEGERAELECLPKTPESTVEWYREGEPLDSTPELAQRIETPVNGSLVLRQAASGDPGEYSCRVRDPSGAVQSASAFLDVHYAAKVVYAPEERFLPLGKPASLDCHFSANPPLTNLRWEKDGFLFDPYNVPGVFYSRNGSLLFNQVDETHEGQYSCTPYNALGTAGPSPRVTVRVRRPPALHTTPLPLYVARLGATLALPCSLTDQHDPSTTVTWRRKDGAPLPPGRHTADTSTLSISPVAEQDRGVYVCVAANDAASIAAETEVTWRHTADTSTLSISPVAEQDRGVYVCVAANDAASIAAETEVLVENAPPRAPRDLAATPARDSVHVKWRAGAAGELEYAVWYRSVGAREWRTMRLLSRGVTEATLGGLRPRTQYEVRVLSQDPLGDGLFSKPIFVTTTGDGSEEVTSTRAETVPTEAPAAPAVPATEGAAPWEAGSDSAPEEPPDGDDIQVSIRLLDDGALVRWAPGDDSSRCAVRWYEEDKLLASVHTQHDYFLVKEVTEGAEYWARVSCGVRGSGAASVRVPAWSRLRSAAVGCIVAALLLVMLAGAFYLARRRLPRLRRAPPPPRHPPPPPPPPVKRR